MKRNGSGLFCFVRALSCFAGSFGCSVTLRGASPERGKSFYQIFAQKYVTADTALTSNKRQPGKERTNGANI
jgi:hypothetical protein